MPPARLQDCTDDAFALVGRWLDASRGVKPDARAARLAEVLRDERGLDFARGFVDKVIRPDDPKVAARNLEKASRDVPDFLAWYLRGAVTVGGGFATMAPWAVIPSARRVLRRLAGHLVVDAPPARLGAALGKLAGPGTRLDVVPLGPTVLGPAESDRRLAWITDLLGRDDVPAVSFAVADVVPPTSPWALDDATDQAVDRLVPVFRAALAGGSTLSLLVDGPHDLDLTVAVFRTLLDQDEFAHTTAGITLPASLPDSLGVLSALTEWAAARRSRGGAPVRVRLVDGAHLAEERADALVHGRPSALFATRPEIDAALLRLLDAALTPEHTDAVQIALAGLDPVLVAAARVLAERRGVTDALEVEVLLGMTGTVLDAVRADVGTVTLLTPVVHPDEFDAAIPYLARRLREGAAVAGSASAALSAGGLDDADRAALLDRERARLTTAVAALDDPAPTTLRTQDRRVALGAPDVRTEHPPATDTDAGVDANRQWAADLLRRVPRSPLGTATVRGARVTDRPRLERTIARTAQAGVNWGRQDPQDRAELLDLVAHELETRRADLVEVVVAETAMTLTEADRQVSGAVDAAHHAADRARHLVDVAGAAFVPPRLTVVVAPWNSPVTTPADGVLSALAAGSGVVLKPSPLAKRTGAVLADVLWHAGVPHSMLQLVDLDVSELGRDLVAHPAVDRVLLTGSPDTARSFRWWRAGLPLLAETGAVSAAVVTPAADVDQAVRDVVASAFAQSGQASTAVSLVVLVGSMGEDGDDSRFLRQLADATRALRVAWPTDPSAQLGPLVVEPTGAARSALTELGPGESWLVEPRLLDESGRLWSPGVRVGVRAGSATTRSTVGVPVLGVVQVETLEQAIAIQNGSDHGLVEALHTLDVDEVALWTNRVEAGTLVVNRATTDTTVVRQPVGGWGSSSVGAVAKRGGPDSVAMLGHWEPVPRAVHKSIQLHGLPPRVTALIEASRSGLSFEEFDQVRAGATSDAQARESRFGRSRDTADLGVERNVLRYRPQSVVVRQSEGVGTGDLIRTLAAATAARAHVLLSTARALPGPLTQLLASGRSPLDVVDHLVETDDEFLTRAASGALLHEQWSGGAAEPQDAIDIVLSQGFEPRPHTAFGGPGSRIRLLGGDPLALEEALGAGIDTTIHDAPVVEAGVVEMAHYLREQTVVVTAHRHGDVDPEFARLRL
ncbi:RHH-type proline utilization regulon transcriptional repressor/proline dehydrogenase/delta 1-pyrroline-5-carboxylate dehydrogenase [Curtobacterium flaccumfaciens]|uniref:RHH-type proline utilization regulon transcriptional repressor/proline dehydrogenase/delta 1-pyrroline-5-carboxylate dehydrogenase n=1 Tax=Curtobacterium salicis TaxID=1779862 RepID=A0ABX0T839_9MICO|nr:proline dehydrogenase family protein [Curtobacterium sp. WW7]NII41672.1 RHH-type proline utilization regulon transcriptional repressor/proline dehydrogenase/delta 1-pyrroline-5-carboxylate dehydrogenase [Curtobacterium sp. WW7]